MQADTRALHNRLAGSRARSAVCSGWSTRMPTASMCSPRSRPSRPRSSRSPSRCSTPTCAIASPTPWPGRRGRGRRAPRRADGGRAPLREGPLARRLRCGAGPARPGAASSTRRRTPRSRRSAARAERAARGSSWPPAAAPLGSSPASIPASENGWMMSWRWPMTSAGARRAPLRAVRRGAAEEQALDHRRARLGVLAQRVEHDVEPPRHAAGGVAACRAETRRIDRSPKVSATISGVNASAQPSSALSSTGISIDHPAQPLRRLDGGLERRVGAQRRAQHDGLVDLEVVEQRDRPRGRTRSSSSATCRSGGPSGRGRAGRA